MERDRDDSGVCKEEKRDLTFIAGSTYLAGKVKAIKGGIKMINFEEEIQRFKPSLEVEAVSDAIVKSDLTDMADIMMDIMKDIKKEK